MSSGEVVQAISAPATVQAAARQDVAAALSGVVLDVAVADGERVRRGQVVLRLTSEQVDLARRQARAAEAAASGVGAVGVDAGGEETLAATRAAVARLDRSTKPRLRRARAQAARIENRQQRRAALSAVAAVEASYHSTRVALLEAGRIVAAQQDSTAASLSRALEQAVAAATAPQRLQAQAAADAADRQARELVVRAPFAGIVQLGDAAASDGASLPAGLPGDLGDVADAAAPLSGLAGGEGGGTLRVGAPVVAGQTLFTVFDVSEVYAEADIDEIDAPQARVGQGAVVVVDAFPDVPLEGTVERIAVAATTTAAGGIGYPTRVRLLGPVDEDQQLRLRRLRVGMTASAEITTKTTTSDTVVPSRALLRREAGDIVYAVRDGRAVEVPVDVVALGEERAAVTGDLTGDDVVIVSGYEEIDDGAEVAE